MSYLNQIYTTFILCLFLCLFIFSPSLHKKIEERRIKVVPGLTSTLADSKRIQSMIYREVLVSVLIVLDVCKFDAKSTSV